MLNRMDFSVAVRKRRSQPRISNRLRRNRDIDRMGKIDPPKHNAGARRCRSQCDLNTLTAMQAHAHGTGQRFEGSLFQHRAIIKARPPTADRWGCAPALTGC